LGEFPQNAPSRLVVAAAVGLDATYFHGSAATSIQRDARGGGRGFSKGGRL